MSDKRASGGKDYGRIERLRGHVLRRSYPDRAKLLREIAMCLRSCKHVRFAAFMAGKLEHQMRRSHRARDESRRERRSNDKNDSRSHPRKAAEPHFRQKNSWE